MKMTQEEYLKLLEEVSNSDYEAVPEDDWIDTAWIPGESGVKERFQKYMGPSQADITNHKRGEIGKSLLQYGAVKIGDFLVRVHKCSNGNNPTTHVELEIWEHRTRTPSGHPCNMDFRIHIKKDTRFEKCAWIAWFNDVGESRDLLIHEAVEVIRWLQAAHKINAFM